MTAFSRILLPASLLAAFLLPGCSAGNSAPAITGGTPQPPAPSSGTSQSAFVYTTVGSRVSFTDTSAGGPNGWAWTFGDGATSSLQNPVHSYSAAGSYQVTLAVTRPSGTATPASQTLAVTAAPAIAPMAAFTFATSAPAIGQSVTFVDESSNLPTSWAWNFGDGSTSALANPAHAYGVAGTYTVTLTAGNAAGANSASQAVTAVAAAGAVPTAGFSFLPSAPVVGQPVAFTDASSGSPTSWSWQLGDTSLDNTSSSRNPQHIFRAAGTYSVTLTAANAAGSGTPSTRTVIVSASSTKPTAGFLVAPAAPAAGQLVALTDTSTGGATAWSWQFADDGSTSTDAFPVHVFGQPGTYAVTLTATNSLGSASASQQVTVGAALPADSNPYNMPLTLSDGAQQTTLAFDGLAMLTGNLEAQSFFPPGKVADYTGFQYLRDNTPNGLGHNTDFMTYAANNILYLLNDAQLAQLKALAVAQQNDINAYGLQRYSLMKAFRRLIDGDLPAGAGGLNQDAVALASSRLYLIDGQIAFDRASLYASIYASMAGGTPCNSDPGTTQLACLDSMKAGFSSWPVLTDAQVASINARMSGLENGVVVAMMTYAGDILSWYVGNLDADVYFCPERHGTYYGGFYVKDGPAVGVPGYQISTTLTATAGLALSDPTQKYVSAAQAAIMDTLVGLQRDNLYAGSSNIVQVRTEIATLLRSLRTSTSNAALIRDRVLALSALYGQLDGQDNWNYAAMFAQVWSTLGSAQKAQLAALRQSILSGRYQDGTPFDFTTCTTFYLYSGNIMDTSQLQPLIADTDYLFFEP